MISKSDFELAKKLLDKKRRLTTFISSQVVILNPEAMNFLGLDLWEDLDSMANDEILRQLDSVDQEINSIIEPEVDDND